jgi:GT2 family glycosyltransferase
VDEWPPVSIVIPVGQPNSYLDEALEACRKLDYPDFEIIVLPDAPFDPPPGVRVIPTGPALPGDKRDAALPHCRGEIVAFLDDDTYPKPNWLTNAARYFRDETVAAIGGPAVTPPGDSPLQRASGQVYASFLGGGGYGYRYEPRATRDVDDYPTCNLIVRRSVLQALGGFDTCFWPGEDTKLCLQITHDLERRIVYAPDVQVYHHRRPLFAAHLRQIRSYALHRGYFAKRFPQTSLRPGYLVPTLFVFGLGLGPLVLLLHPAARCIYASGLGLYATGALVEGFARGGLRLGLPVAAGIFATHVVYGIWFVVGLLSPRLPEEVEK